MRLCRCEHPPLRDALDPQRRWSCAGCGGLTPRGQPPAPEQLHRRAVEALGWLNAVASAYRLVYPGLWEPLRGDGGRVGRGGHADPAGAAAANTALREKRLWASAGWERLDRAASLLETADQALGMAAMVDNRHREDRRSSAWDRPVTADTPADQVPLHLEAAHRALIRRQQEGL